MENQTPTYPLVPTANFIACFLTLSVLLTSPFRQAFNRGVCLLSAWVSVMALVTGIQAVVWRKTSDTTLLPGFCDICLFFSAFDIHILHTQFITAIRLQIGSVSAETACTLIITRYLFRVVKHPLIPIDECEVSAANKNAVSLKPTLHRNSTVDGCFLTTLSSSAFRSSRMCSVSPVKLISVPCADVVHSAKITRYKIHAFKWSRSLGAFRPLNRRDWLS